MQVCPGDAGPCLLLLLLLYWLLLDRKFTSTWDLVERSLYLGLSLVVVHAYDSQCCQGQRSCKETHVQWF